MNLVRQLGTNSAIYIATNLLQKGTAFLLMPLYTRYLDPRDYGVLGIVTAINSVLAVAFTLGLTAAMTRFYFEYRDQPDLLAEFWGAILGFVLVFSTLVGGTMLLMGDALLGPLLTRVDFWPYVALGVLTTFFQPFLTAYLAVLQTRNQAGLYAIISIANFITTTTLTVALVICFRWGAAGPLTAALLSAIVFFSLAIWMLRGDLRINLSWRHLRPALAYSLPLVPHSLAGSATAFADRLVLNRYIGTAATGIYTVGAMVAMIVEIAVQSINRAYVPLSMDALKRGTAEDLEQIRTMGAVVIALTCLVGAAAAAFSREVIWLLAAPSFAAAASVVPILVFAGVASGFYYLFVNILFFEQRAVRLVAVATVAGAAASVTFAFLLVPRFGMLGAASSTLLAQILTAVLVAILGARFDPIRWNYGRYALAFVTALAFAVALGDLRVPSLIVGVAVKLASLVLLLLLLGALLWQRPLILVQAIAELLRRQPGRAIALFFETKAST